MIFFSPPSYSLPPSIPSYPPTSAVPLNGNNKRPQETPINSTQPANKRLKIEQPPYCLHSSLPSLSSPFSTLPVGQETKPLPFFASNATSGLAQYNTHTQPIQNVPSQQPNPHHAILQQNTNQTFQTAKIPHTYLDLHNIHAIIPPISRPHLELQIIRRLETRYRAGEKTKFSVLLTGPQGCGRTELLTSLAVTLFRDYSHYHPSLSVRIIDAKQMKSRSSKLIQP